MPKVPNIPPEPEITDEQREAAEAEIREKQKPVDYDTNCGFAHLYVLENI